MRLEDRVMMHRFQLLILSLLDRYYGLERLALRAGLSAEDARRVAHSEL
jgi:hypothetical protein